MRQLGTLELRQESRPKLREPVERHVRLHRHSVARHAPLVLPLLRGKTANGPKRKTSSAAHLVRERLLRFVGGGPDIDLVPYPTDIPYCDSEMS